MFSERTFWIVTPCSLIEVHGFFWGTYCFHLHSITENQISKQQRNCLFLFVLQPWRRRQGVILVCSFDSEDGGSMFLRNVSERLLDYTAWELQIQQISHHHHRHRSVFRVGFYPPSIHVLYEVQFMIWCLDTGVIVPLYVQTIRPGSLYSIRFM
jgi:hypothetical protein